MSTLKKAAVWWWNNYSKVIYLGGLAIGFVGPAWAAYVAPLMSTYAPLSWVASGLLGSLIVACTVWLAAAAYAKAILAQRTAAIMADQSVNPLEVKFERKLIRLIDFYHPQFISHKNKDFRDCELAGPGLVYFEGAHIEGVEFKHVQIAIARSENKHIFGVTAFNNPKFVGGRFTNLTLLMSQAMYDTFPDDIKQHVPIISG